MRKQYHFRPGSQGLRAWDIQKLVKLAESLPVIRVPLSAIRELDETFWYYYGTVPTCRDIAEHARLINEADLNYPLLLSSDGRVMDGMHRVAKSNAPKYRISSGKEVCSRPRTRLCGC